VHSEKEEREGRRGKRKIEKKTEKREFSGEFFPGISEKREGGTLRKFPRKFSRKEGLSKEKGHVGEGVTPTQVQKHKHIIILNYKKKLI